MLCLFISHLTLVVGQILKMVATERNIPSTTEKITTNMHFRACTMHFKSPGFSNLPSGPLNKMRSLLSNSCVIKINEKGMSFFFIRNKNKGKCTDLTLYNNIYSA